MSKQYWTAFWTGQTDAFRLSLATAVGCLAGAGAFAVCNRTTAGLHSAEGIALVGAFYFLLALVGAKWRYALPATQTIPWSFQRRISPPRNSAAHQMPKSRWQDN